MPAPTPPAKVRRIRTLASGGATSREISERTGVPYGTVLTIRQRLLRRGHLERAIAPRGERTDFRTCSLPAAALDRLKKEAAARGLATSRLAARLLTVIAEDGMVDAILDDKGGRGRGHG